MAGALVAGAQYPNSWEDLLSALEAADLEDVSHPVDSYPVPRLSAIFDLSLSSLTTEDQRRLLNLAIFPQRASISLAQFYQVWGQVGKENRRLIKELVDKSLLQQTGKDDFALHSLLRLHIRRKVDNLGSLYLRLVPILSPDLFPLFVAVSWRDHQGADEIPHRCQSRCERGASEWGNCFACSSRAWGWCYCWHAPRRKR